MTAQVGDRFIYKGNEYSIVAISNPIQFYPLDYGIKPSACCSACWDGYWCDYQICTEGIMLKNLYINSENGDYPEINNVRPEKNGKNSFKYMGHHFYKNINIFMEYTGKILIGKDFMQEYYIHMGYQRAWSYKVLEELIFEADINPSPQITKSDFAALLNEIHIEELSFSFESKELLQFVSLAIKTGKKQNTKLKRKDGKIK